MLTEHIESTVPQEDRMAVKEAQRVGGGSYAPLKELGRKQHGKDRGEFASKHDDGTLAVFRIVDLEDEDCPPTKNDKGWDCPLIADVLVIHQDEEGEVTGNEVFLRQRIRFAPVWVLRNQKKPDSKVKLREIPDPDNEVGDEVICRIHTKKGGEEGWTALQTPTADDKKKALAVRKELGGDDWGDAGDDF